MKPRRRAFAVSAERDGGTAWRDVSARLATDRMRDILGRFDDASLGGSLLVRRTRRGSPQRRNQPQYPYERKPLPSQDKEPDVAGAGGGLPLSPRSLPHSPPPQEKKRDRVTFRSFYQTGPGCTPLPSRNVRPPQSASVYFRTTRRVPGSSREPTSYPPPPRVHHALRSLHHNPKHALTCKHAAAQAVACAQ